MQLSDDDKAWIHDTKCQIRGADYVSVDIYIVSAFHKSVILSLRRMVKYHRYNLNSMCRSQTANGIHK